MNTLTLGLRNAFRNAVRASSIIVILGLSIGLCLVMLIAYQAVGQKITDVKTAVGNTITISPAGFSGFNQVGNALTTSDLAKIKSLNHITNVTENLTDRLTTIGSAQPQFGKFGMSANSTDAQTSLTSPITLNNDGNGGLSGGDGGTRVFINGGSSLPANFSLPIPIVGTTDPTKVSGSNVTLTSGTLLDGAKDINDALVSTDMASKNNLKVGSTFTAYGATLTVTGIFDAGSKGANSTIVVALPTLQRLSGKKDQITSAIATVDSLDNLASVTTAAKSALGSVADVQSSQDEANNTVKPLENVASISMISLIGAVVAGSIIILLTMVMIVRERRREIGILKAIGASNGRIVMQFMFEAVTLTLAGALVGIAIGITAGSPVTNMLVSSSTSAVQAQSVSDGGPATRTFGGEFRASFGARPVSGGFFQRGGGSLANSVRNVSVNVGWNILAYGLAAALLIASIGSSIAGWMIAHIRPSEVMRAE